MARTVSSPAYTHTIAYRDISDFDEDGFLWRELVDWIKSTAQQHWPSLYDYDKWVGRENHAILANVHALIGVSEYCGLLAIWLLPQSNADEPLAQQWCDQIAPKFRRLFGELTRVCAASNGEVLYRRIHNEQTSS